MVNELPLEIVNDKVFSTTAVLYMIWDFEMHAMW